MQDGSSISYTLLCYKGNITYHFLSLYPRMVHHKASQIQSCTEEESDTSGDAGRLCQEDHKGTQTFKYVQFCLTNRW